MNTKQIGEISEAFIIAELLKKGYSVSKPFGDNQKYDLIIDDGKNLLRGQCKTATLDDTVLQCPITRTKNIWKKGERHRQPYSKNEVDVFLFYNLKLNKVYWVPFEVVENKNASISLRLEPPKNNQTKGIFLAKEFEIKEIL